MKRVKITVEATVETRGRLPYRFGVFAQHLRETMERIENKRNLSDLLPLEYVTEWGTDKFAIVIKEDSDD